jgi:dipeptidyl aminopeptidase/acylaminoacyl peptidase
MKILFLLIPWILCAQVTSADYERARGLKDRFQGLAVNVPGPITWIGDTGRFWYRKSAPKGSEFVLVDAPKGVKTTPFAHPKLAESLSAASGRQYTALTLPFSEFRFVDREQAIEFAADGSTWRCDLTRYACSKTVTSPQASTPARSTAPAEFENDVFDGISNLSPQTGPELRAPQESMESRVSPDGKWEALIRNYNVFLRPKGKADGVALSFDGSEGNYYTLQSVAWSPDSTRIVACRTRPGYRREVHYVESSPADQLQPKHSTRVYAKPGDALDIAQPVLFHVETKKFIDIPMTLFPNAYSLSRPVWWKDGRAFTFEYNQRGHQLYRLIEVDGMSGVPRVLISEESSTFVDYRPLVPNPRDTGKKVRYDVADGKEIVWGSERDGWEHLYLYDGKTGKVKNQITKGNWVVRAIDKVDEGNRQIWFQASGMYAGKDPYFVHQYRINFDGTGLAAYTEADGDHTVKFSPDGKYYVDTWSRVDQAPVSQLRSTEDKKLVMELERGDSSALAAAGWRAPEPFSAPGRDGKTEIWGVIHRPANFDPARKYPVVEAIYAGPQGSFVPKAFSETVQPLTELGFVVAQIDGMGTNNRSKAFHEVAFKNLADAGFADRILWHRAMAAKYAWYDTSRMGIFGNSAGGQNSMGALLFHPEFYKVAVSSSGCHDNRMDKIWWNELWMSWPLGPHYAASSNVENATKLQGRLLLVVGEMDTNVDPSSTFQVVNALIKANKKFDLLAIPGGGHGLGGDYGQRLLQDFFVHHLLGVEPPDWNTVAIR